MSTGNAVTFDWSPACGVAMLIVREIGDQPWMVRSPNFLTGPPDLANRISPRVTYGQVPAGMEASVARPLVAGRTYTLELWRIVPEAIGSVPNCQSLFGDCVVATQTFVR